MASPKVTFESGGAFVRETRREVEAYLASRRTRVWGSVRLYTKAPVALGLLALSWSVLVLAHPGPVVGVACLGGLTLGALLTAFCVQHDANHGRVLSPSQPQPSPRLDDGRTARLLQLRLAREAQRRPSHLYECRRTR